MIYKRRKKWDIKATRDDIRESRTVTEITEVLKVSPVTAQLLINRGCTTPEQCAAFLDRSSEKLHDPFLMKDMKKAAQRILEAVRKGEKIAIYGDYDVDGVTSVSALYMYLRGLGADVCYYIPSRLKEGYGMSGDAVRRLQDEGCSLIITVDTGITAFEEARDVLALNMELIITDHHECQDAVPDACAVVNPKQRDCPYPFKELAGVGVVFKLLCALEFLNSNNGLTMTDAVRNVSNGYIDLVATGTIADVMPLRDENRLIVSYGLYMMENKPRPAMSALFDAAGGDGKSRKRKITSGYIGYTVAPRLNAAGRIRSANIAVELFLSDSREKADSVAAMLCEINKERQELENSVIEAAYKKIESEHDFAHDPVIVLADEAWHHGIIGIVASRIAEKYCKPTILISFDQVGDGSGARAVGKDSDVGKGSGRSVKGMNLVEALNHCSDLLVKYGGHELAAGLSIERGKLEEFTQRINDFARGCFDGREPESSVSADCTLEASDVSMAQATELYKLEPFGVSNPMPVFVMFGMKVYSIGGVGGGKHTRLSLSKDSLVVCAMCFRKSPAELDLYEGDTVDVLFNLDINEYQNTRSLQFIVKDISLSDEIQQAEIEERRQYELINGGSYSGGCPSEVVPDRADFAALYSMLRRQVRGGRDTFSARGLCRMLETEGAPCGYIKVKYMLRVFQELNILGVDETDAECETYRFKYIYVKTKADLDKSGILRKLKNTVEGRRQV